MVSSRYRRSSRAGLLTIRQASLKVLTWQKPEGGRLRRGVERTRPLSARVWLGSEI